MSRESPEAFPCPAPAAEGYRADHGEIRSKPQVSTGMACRCLLWNGSSCERNCSRPIEYASEPVRERKTVADRSTGQNQL